MALELLSIPAYMLATWRKRDLKSNEAGLKYYLMGVFASAIMLYGMSLLYGGAGSTLLVNINEAISAAGNPSAVIVLGIIFVIIGFAFKVSAFPFHTWAPDTYEGAPTPVTAFLSVASKAAGFVALMNLLFLGFFGRDDVYEPVLWILAAASMTVGNLIALRQTNIVRMLAYSGVAQAGYMLAPLAVASTVGDVALEATVTYLVVYAAMNLGAFAVVMAVARKTRSAEINSFRGLFHYAPGLTVAMTIFLFSLAGIPPLGGWWAKFRVMEAVIDANTASGVVLGVFVAVNSVIALYYYARIGLGMWAEEAPDGDVTPVRVTPVADGCPWHHRRRHDRLRCVSVAHQRVRRQPPRWYRRLIRWRPRWPTASVPRSAIRARSPSRRSLRLRSTTSMKGSMWLAAGQDGAAIF